MMIDEVVPLYPDRPSAGGPMPFTVHAAPNEEGLWDIVFRMGHSTKELTCKLNVDKVPMAYLQERWENTRNYSLFNSSLYIRKNINGRGETIGRHKHFTLHEDGQITVVELDGDEARSRMLVEQFGISEEAAFSLPPDDPDSGKSV